MTFDKIVKILAESKELDPQTLTAETVLVGDLGLDSLDTVELLMSLEDEFGISLEPNENIKTIGNLVEAVDQELSK